MRSSVKSRGRGNETGQQLCSGRLMNEFVVRVTARRPDRMSMS